MVYNSERGIPTTYVPLKDEAAGLDGVIAIHSSALGSGAGGCRFWNYSSPEAMMTDATRLAEGMSYKNAMARLPFGGAKAVLRRPEGPFDRAALFGAFGRAVEQLGGSYITAEDVGTSTEDMEHVARETRYVAGLPQRDGRPGGDPSPWTARGVFISMQVAALYRVGKPLSDCAVAIQGTGNVGASLARMVHATGARLVVADVNRSNAVQVAAQTRAKVVEPGEIMAADVDIFAPCALGGVLDQVTIPTLKASVVCGAANNQLANPEDGRLLAEREVVYAPDYVVNAGGIINVAAEYLGWESKEAASRVESIGIRLLNVLNYASENQLPTNVAADEMAQKLFAQAREPEVAA